MLLRFFNKNTFANIIALVLLCFVLWLPSFLSQNDIKSVSHMPFFDFLYSTFQNTKLFSVFIAFLLLIGQSFYFNYIVIKHNLFAKNNYMAAFIFVILMSSSTSLLHLNVMSFAGYLILIQIDLLLNSYKKTEANNEIFYTGLISSLLMLTHSPFIIMELFVLVCIALIRPINFRDYLISLMGFLFPLLFVFTYYYWNETLGYFLIKWLNIDFIDSDFSQYSGYNMVYLSAIGVLLLLALFRIATKGLTIKTMLVRKAFSFMFWLLFFGLFIGLFSDIAKVEGYSIVFIPLTILLCNIYLNAKNLFWHELIFSLFFILIVIKNYFYL